MRLTQLSSILALSCLAACVRADLLTTYTMITANGGGQTGAGAETNCMVMADGTTWSGGAAGLQGASSYNPYLTSSPQAANITFKFNTAAMISSLNATYGAGNWAIGGAHLSWTATYWANNNRFGGGAGTFNIYWVSNDNWNATSNDATPAPAYATSDATLSAWASDISLVNDGAYYEWHDPSYYSSYNPAPTWSTYKTTDPWVPRLSYDVALTDALLADALAGGNVSFYLMATSSTLGMTIFTGGYSSGTGTDNQPALSFDIVSVPEPAALSLLSAGAVALAFSRRRR